MCAKCFHYSKLWHLQYQDKTEIKLYDENSFFPEIFSCLHINIEQATLHNETIGSRYITITKQLGKTYRQVLDGMTVNLK